jgi:hypothetical protein
MLSKFNPKRPKVSLRRFIETYILNRGKETEARALKHVYKAIRGGK